MTQQEKNTVFLGVGISVLVLLTIMVLYAFTMPRQGTILLPAGANYLGPK